MEIQGRRMVGHEGMATSKQPLMEWACCMKGRRSAPYVLLHLGVEASEVSGGI